VRVREELLPLLAELSPAVVEHLNALADALGAPAAVGVEPMATLGRAQRRLLERAVTLRQRNARIWLPGGDVLTLDSATLEPRRTAQTRRHKS